MDTHPAPAHPAPAHPLRAVPSVERLLQMPAAAALLDQASRPALVAALREVLGAVRAEASRSGVVASPDVILARAGAQLAASRRPVLRRVLNATGIVLHTNLGRAPMAAEARAAVAAVMAGYCNLEFDLDAGARGARTQGIEPLLRELVGAEACVAVNNNAAAMLLALTALAAGGEVIVSRGELVEIGGGFRIPDIIRQGGARLVEVGTTNKTRLADYRDAITPHTRMLLKVHQSNYRIIGFTAAASMAELAGLAREQGLLLMEDLGSGTLLDLRRLGRPHEPTVGESLAGGADLVAFSGDKLLGGPQAGLVVGREAAVAPLRKHPLMRALRLDKMTLAALEATLLLYRDTDRAVDLVPAMRMLGQDPARLRVRAERLAALLDGADVRVEPTQGYAGGGSLPADAIPSFAVSLALPGVPAETLARRLRDGTPALVGRLAEGRLLLDALTLADAELALVAEAVRAAA